MPSIVRVYHATLLLQSTRMASRFADKVLKEMQIEAKANAAGGTYSKGRLAETIRRSGPDTIGRTVVGSIYSRSPYAASVEGGAKVHEIFPKGSPHTLRFGHKKRPMLKFIWHGHMVYLNQIPGGPGTVGRSHPGQSGKHYMSRAMVGTAVRFGLRVVIYDI